MTSRSIGGTPAPAWGLAATAVLATAAASIVAQAPSQPLSQSPPPAATAQAATPAANVVPRRFVTRHRGVFGGRRIHYEAIAEESILQDPRGTPAATLFTFSYLEHRGKSDPSRPVLFVFNGGPGSASIWTHFGMLGPRQVSFPDPVSPPTAPPFAIADNPHSLLDVADLVFIDPVLTGFSRLLPAGKAEDFLGVTQDARATAEFIRQWLTRYGRWNSPKFLVGESYGTVRAITLAGTLLGGVFPPNGSLGAISLNGIVILGPAFTSGGARLEGDDRGHLTILPTMTATAWYHGKLGPKDQPVEVAIEAARGFARDEYLKALNAGYTLEVPERERIAKRLSELTGVPAAAWLDANLRLGGAAFQTLLLRDEGKQLGAYDMRYALPAKPNGNDPVVDDPAMGQYTPGFVAAFNEYLSAELGVAYTERYVPIAWTDVNFKWNYGAGPGINLPRNDATELATAMRRNPELRAFIAVGYYDLVTTLGAAEHALAHAAIPRERLTLKGYPSGHMPYLGEESARALAADLRTFVRGAVRGGGVR